MAGRKRIDQVEVLGAALALLESGGPVSLRRVAMEVGVKAPSLYFYYADKAALDRAIAEEGWRLLLEAVRESLGRKKKTSGFVTFTVTYVAFAKERPELYRFMTRHGKAAEERSTAREALWQLMVRTVSGISGVAEDVSTAAAVWSFLHGYVDLERVGGFGPRGSEHGFSTGLEVFVRWGAS